MAMGREAGEWRTALTARFVVCLRRHTRMNGGVVERLWPRVVCSIYDDDDEYSDSLTTGELGDSSTKAEETR